MKEKTSIKYSKIIILYITLIKITRTKKYNNEISKSLLLPTFKMVSKKTQTNSFPFQAITSKIPPFQVPFLK